MGKHHKYTDEELKDAVKKSVSLVETLRRLGYEKIAGGNSCHLRDKLIKKGIDFSHFTGQGWKKDKPDPRRLSAAEILIYQKSERRPQGKRLARALLEVGHIYKCKLCPCDGTWNGKQLTLHVDHIDGNWDNNTEDNLRFLCPNCHATTDNFGNKKRK